MSKKELKKSIEIDFKNAFDAELFPEGTYCYIQALANMKYYELFGKMYKEGK